MLSPIAVGYLLFVGLTGRGAFVAMDPRTDVLLMCAGVFTVFPLVWYTSAARRLRYITIGVLQYIAPTIQLLLGVVAFGEPFTRTHWITFGLIGAGNKGYHWLKEKHK